MTHSQQYLANAVRVLSAIAEGTQAVVWHLLVSHPKLQMRPTKW
jgi:hypothetical protein